MIGPPAFIILYVLPCSFALIILYFQLPETKNKEIHEIVAELKHEATMETILLET
jgi:TRAP-type C4-dicarboxylate transport system permease small subunit